jgi:excisionase family DNA binding protein
MPDAASRPDAAGPERVWMALGPASRLLGVDPDTLRRWADEGRVEAYLTPGGHRRFERASLERMAATRRGGPRSSMTNLGATPERLSRAYRRSYATPRSVSVHSGLGSPDREAYRDDGRRLVLALIAHLDAEQPATRRAAEEEAGLATDEVARRLAAAGTDLADAIAQFVAARRPFLAEIGALAARRALDPASLSALYQGASDLLDRLLLRLVATFQAATGPSGSDS